MYTGRAYAPSPPHGQLPQHAHLRHQRRDSDTVRRNDAGSPTVVEGAPLRHRRSPTAQEPPMKQLQWATEPEQPHQQLQHQYPQQQQAQTQPMQAPPAKAASAVQLPLGGTGRHLFVSDALPNTAAAASFGAPPPPRRARAHQTCFEQVNKKPYARLDMIGKGGSSRVFRVMNVANEIYAVKRVQLDKVDAETMAGYMNEIGLLKRLEGNARIIRLYDSEVKSGAGGTKGCLMLVMECGEIGACRRRRPVQ